MSNEIVAISTADVTSDMREYDVRELEGSNLAAFCSVKAETMEDKALVFNAANNPQHKVADYINKKIMLHDVYAETLELINKETGELDKAPRIVLIDDKGEAYECRHVLCAEEADCHVRRTYLGAAYPRRGQAGEGSQRLHAHSFSPVLGFIRISS